MNIADLWPEQAEKLGLVKNRYILRITYRLEKFIYKYSDLITGQTMGIVNNIKERNPDSSVYWLRNGIDVNNYQKYNTNLKIIEPLNQSHFILIYAGIIGYAQGLDTILLSANELKNYTDIKFLLVGSGPEKERLQKLKQELNLDNVIFKKPISKSEIPGLVSLSSAGIVPLKKIPFFEGAIPSKIFDILGSKKPLLLGVKGEAYNLFIEQADCGLFFEPEDYKDLSNKILQLYSNPDLGNKLGEKGYDFVNKFFNWNNIAGDLIKEFQRNFHNY